MVVLVIGLGSMGRRRIRLLKQFKQNISIMELIHRLKDKTSVQRNFRLKHMTPSIKLRNPIGCLVPLFVRLHYHIIQLYPDV